MTNATHKPHLNDVPQPAKRGRGRPRKYALPEGVDMVTAFAGVPKNVPYKYLTAEQLEARRMYDALRQRGRSKASHVRHRNSASKAARPLGQVHPAPPVPAPAPTPASAATDMVDDELLPAELAMIEIRRAWGFT